MAKIGGVLKAMPVEELVSAGDKGTSSVAQEEEEVKLKALREAIVVSAVGGLCAYYGAGDAGKVARAAVEVAEAAIAVLAPPFAKPQQKAT